MQIERLQVLGGKHSFDTRQLDRRLLIDRFDKGVAIRRADEIAEQHARKFEIIDIIALALCKTNVLDPLSPGAEAFEFLRARPGRLDFGGHSAASLIRSAAARIALTMVR